VSVAQSLGDAHSFEWAHFGQPPPQSVSVSLPLSMPSVQVAVWQASGKPEQTLLAQSVLPLHALFAPHAWQFEPPQSVSVSVPFLTPSVQLEDAHSLVKLSHFPLWQSAFTWQVIAVAQAEHDEPPQSTSVSELFFLPSVHEPS
jgi:hypothetical protein